MKKQLVLFEPDVLETELVAVLRQLPPDRKKVATQLLAKLMARSLVDSKSEGSQVRGKGGADE